MTQTTKYIILTLITFVVGFVFLHTAYYEHVKNPYAQEIVLIVLGTVATILITAALLNKQSELELDKEHHIKIFELKSSIYLDLINFLEKIVTKGKVSKDELIYLEFLTHKISLVASQEVLQEYSYFLDVINKAVDDRLISESDSDEISTSLAKLTVKIREDLLQNDDESVDLEKLIVRNVNKL
jgi:hypothetical protein